MRANPAAGCLQGQLTSCPPTQTCHPLRAGRGCLPPPGPLQQHRAHQQRRALRRLPGECKAGKHTTINTCTARQTMQHSAAQNGSPVSASYERSSSRWFCCRKPAVHSSSPSTSDSAHWVWLDTPPNAAMLLSACRQAEDTQLRRGGLSNGVAAARA